jgi:dTDP-4-amino-4,6-dideoxygalactose transaminase
LSELLGRLVRIHGLDRDDPTEVVGRNVRLTDLHAPIGRVPLTKVDGWTKQRQDNAAYLSSNLQGVTPPPVADGAVHVYHQYTVRVPQDRDGFAKALREEYNVGSGMFYPVPNHQLVPFAGTTADADLPETMKAAAECLSLPIHPSLSQDDLERIVTAVNTLAKAGG